MTSRDVEEEVCCVVLVVAAAESCEVMKLREGLLCACIKEVQNTSKRRPIRDVKRENMVDSSTRSKQRQVSSPLWKGDGMARVLKKSGEERGGGKYVCWEGALLFSLFTAHVSISVPPDDHVTTRQRTHLPLFHSPLIAISRK